MLFRRRNGGFEVLLAHPGGPFWRHKDGGAWTIPKGGIDPGETPLDAAIREFHEETGFRSAEPYLPLGAIMQRGGKTVHAWAVEGDLPEQFELKSNLFQIEWPSGSGKFKEFPEIDRAEFFPEEIARQKINPAQIPFLDRLRDSLHAS